MTTRLRTSWFVLVLALVVSALAASCASSRVVKMYSGSELDAAHVAIVRPATEYEFGVFGERPGVRILRVDGVGLQRSDVDSHCAVELLPGNHRMTVATTITVEGKRVAFEDSVPLAFRCEAGAEYSVFCQVVPGPTPDQPVVRFWMEDASGRTVSTTG
jgi:hypothetical protein